MRFKKNIMHSGKSMLFEFWVISLLPRTVSRYSSLTCVSYSVYLKVLKMLEVVLELTQKPSPPLALN